ncbi:hypothetical protein GCM10009734_25100 [Nonomuraea bangladeshensis]
MVIVRIILEGAAPGRNPAWLLRIDGGSLPAFMVARPIGGAHGCPLADWARDRLGLTLKIVSRFRRQRLVGLVGDRVRRPRWCGSGGRRPYAHPHTRQKR